MLRSLSRQTRLFSLRNLNQRWCNVPHGLSVRNRKKVNDIAFKWAHEKNNKKITNMTLCNCSFIYDISPLLFSVILDRNIDSLEVVRNDPRINKELGSVLIDRLTYEYNEVDILEILKILLKDPRINPSCCLNYPLKFAVSHNYVKVAKLLLDDPRVDPTIDGNFAFILACERNNVSIVKLFLRDKRIDPWAYDFAAIRAACEGNSRDVVGLFSFRHDFATIKAACKERNREVLRLLLRRANNDIYGQN